MASHRFEPVHQRLALRLVIRQARLGAQLRLARLLIVVEYLAEHLEHHLAFVRKHLFQVAELAPAMRQAVTPDHRRVIGHLIARQRVRHRQRFVKTRLPFVQQPLEVFARMTAAGVIQNGGVLPHLHHQRRGVHPGAFQGHLVFGHGVAQQV